MSPSRRTRLSVFAAALSGTLVVAMTITSTGAADLDCTDVRAVLDADPAGGVVCESLPSRGAGDDDAEPEADAVPATTPAAAPDHGDGADGGCPEGADDRELFAADGIACEQQVDTEGQQVAVFPQGGVATGRAARP